MVIFHSYVNVYQGVSSGNQMTGKFTIQFDDSRMRVSTFQAPCYSVPHVHYIPGLATKLIVKNHNAS